MPAVTKGARGSCQDCGGFGPSWKTPLNVEVGSMTFTLCEKCAEELRDELIEWVGKPDEED